MKKILIFSMIAGLCAVQLSWAGAVKIQKKVKPQLQKTAPVIKSSVMKQRPSLTMNCLEPSNVNLHLSYTISSWSVNPSQLKPQSFTKAYGKIDANDKTKVTLGCVYQAVGDYVASTSYNGLQKCPANETTGKGAISYTGPSGYTMNVVGTSAKGKLYVQKVGESIANQGLVCQFHFDGRVQLFKKFESNIKLSSCSAEGNVVTCI